MKNVIGKKGDACGYASDPIGYLYDEMSRPHRDEYESHLADCGICADEFATLSFARLDVYEWHRDEFAPIETPHFVIPYDERAPRFSWIDGLSTAFGFNSKWLVGGAAAAIMVVTLSVGFVVLDDTATVAHRPQASVPVKSTVGAPPHVADSRKVKTLSADNEPKEPTSTRPADHETVTTAVKKVPRPARQIDRAAGRNLLTKFSEPALSKYQKAPRLNDFEDEDDNTLRLGDLLADVDAKE